MLPAFMHACVLTITTPAWLQCVFRSFIGSPTIKGNDTSQIQLPAPFPHFVKCNEAAKHLGGFVPLHTTYVFHNLTAGMLPFDLCPLTL